MPVAEQPPGQPAAADETVLESRGSKAAAPAIVQHRVTGQWDAVFPAKGGASLRVKLVDTATAAQAAQQAAAGSSRIAVNLRAVDGGLSIVQVGLHCSACFPSTDAALRMIRCPAMQHTSEP